MRMYTIADRHPKSGIISEDSNARLYDTCVVRHGTRKTRMTKKQRDGLDFIYRLVNTPDVKLRGDVANVLNLEENQVRNWFANRSVTK